MAREKFLGSASAEQRTHLVEHLFLRRNLAFFGQIPRCAEGLSAWHNRHFHERIGVFAEPRNRRVTSFVQGDGTFFCSSHHFRFLLQTADDSIDRVEEVLLRDGFGIATRSDERSLVADIGDVGTRKAGRLTSQEVDVETFIDLDRLQMDLENLLALGQVGQIDVDFTVETTGTQQGRIEHIDAVRRRQNNDARVRSKTVHLGEQGVERVFALVVAAHRRIFRAGTAYGVDFVDENNARSLGFGLLEGIAHATRAHADEHFHEIASRHREKRHTSLACNGFRQQRFTRSRRTNEQGSFGNFTAQIGVFLRIFQKFHDFLHLLLRASLSSHVLERDAEVVGLLVEFRLRPAHVEHSAAESASHTAVEQIHQEHEKNQRTEIVENSLQRARAVVVIAEVGDFSALLNFGQIGFERVGRTVFHRDERLRPRFLSSSVEHVANVLRLHKHLQFALRRVHFDLLRVAAIDIFLELRISGFLLDRTHRRIRHRTACVGHKNIHQPDENQHIEPSHIKLGHLRVFSLLGRFFILFLFHNHFFKEFRSYRSCRSSDNSISHSSLITHHLSLITQYQESP